jgi:hypothetical protein
MRGESERPERAAVVGHLDTGVTSPVCACLTASSKDAP